MTHFPVGMILAQRRWHGVAKRNACDTLKMVRHDYSIDRIG
jgi:hypothetical protein